MLRYLASHLIRKDEGMTLYGFVVGAWLLLPFAQQISVPFESMEICEQARQKVIQVYQRRYAICVRAKSNN